VHSVEVFKLGTRLAWVLCLTLCPIYPTRGWLQPKVSFNVKWTNMCISRYDFIVCYVCQTFCAFSKCKVWEITYTELDLVGGWLGILQHCL